MEVVPVELQGWRSVQGRRPDGAIDSDERVTVDRPVVNPSEAGAWSLGGRYWREVRDASHCLVGARTTTDGLELRLFGRGPCLLRFGRPEIAGTADGVSCRYPILGGLLARRPGGALTLSQTGGGEPELRAAVTGFVPRLRGPLYAQIQQRAHIAISRRYFRRLIGEASQ